MCLVEGGPTTVDAMFNDVLKMVSVRPLCACVGSRMEAQKSMCRAVWTQKCASSSFDLAVVKVISTHRVKQSGEDTCVSEADGDSKRNIQNSFSSSKIHTL